MDTIIEQRRRSRTLALSGKFSDDDADAAHFSFSARQESARNSSEPRGHVVSVLVEAIHCFVNLREAVSVAGPRIILRDVLSGVPLSFASLTLPWNVISTDAIENWFWPENVRNPWTQRRKKQLRKREKEWSALVDDFRTFLLGTGTFELAFSTV